MTKRLLILLLLLCTLVSGQAWAWDNHDGLITGEAVNIGLTQPDTDGNPGADTPVPCDHYCCHGMAHLAGLFPADIPLNAPQAGALESPCQNILISHSREPLFKPPQA